MRNIAFMILLMSNMIAFGQQKKFEVRGKIDGWRQPQRVMLQYTIGDSVVMDTAEAFNGRFKFAGRLPGPVVASVVLISKDVKGGTRDHRRFYLDGGIVSVIHADSLKRAWVRGSKLTAEGEELLKAVEPKMERAVALKLKAMRLTQEERQGTAVQAMQAEFDAIANSVTEARKTFISRYPESFVALDALKSMIGGVLDYHKIAPVYAMLGEKLRATEEGKRIGRDLEVAGKISAGAVMPDFTSLDTLRKPLKLSEVVRKGKVTLVDFWASWCAPCRAENPNVVKAFKAFHGRGFNILSVSLDRSLESWKKAIVQDGMPWYHVSGLKYWDEPVAKDFGITGVPDSFLLDGEGRVIARGLRGEALYRKIEDLLKMNEND